MSSDSRPYERAALVWLRCASSPVDRGGACRPAIATTVILRGRCVFLSVALPHHPLRPGLVPVLRTSIRHAEAGDLATALPARVLVAGSRRSQLPYPSEAQEAAGAG